MTLPALRPSTTAFQKAAAAIEALKKLATFDPVVTLPL